MQELVNLGKSTNNFMSNSGYQIKIIDRSHRAVMYIFGKFIKLAGSTNTVMEEPGGSGKNRPELGGTGRNREDYYFIIT